MSNVDTVSEPRRDNRSRFCQQAGTSYRDSTAVAAGPDLVKEYSAFVKELLEAEEKRNSTMETRAVAVITTSGVLVTLLLAFAALVTRVQTFRVPGFTLFLAGASACLFVAAALCGILTNAPWRVWTLKPDCLNREIWERWGDAGDDPVAKTTVTRLALWGETHKLTQRKAKLLFAATAFQSLAVVILVGAVLNILASA
jgi:hypothetical protein